MTNYKSHTHSSCMTFVFYISKVEQDQNYKDSGEIVVCELDRYTAVALHYDVNFKCTIIGYTKDFLDYNYTKLDMCEAGIWCNYETTTFVTDSLLIESLTNETNSFIENFEKMKPISVKNRNIIF